MSKEKGNKFEDKVRKSINSGALWFDKGDLSSNDHLIDCKYTDKGSYRITTATLQKIWNESFDANKLPALIIGIKDWILTVKITRR
jgi:hypothetical protein